MAIFHFSPFAFSGSQIRHSIERERAWSAGEVCPGHRERKVSQSHVRYASANARTVRRQEVERVARYEGWIVIEIGLSREPALYQVMHRLRYAPI